MNNDSESTAITDKTILRTNNNDRARVIYEEPSNGELYSTRSNEKKRDSFLPPI